MRSTSFLIIGLFIVVLFITAGLLVYLFILSPAQFSFSNLLPQKKYTWSEAQEKAATNCKEINFPKEETSQLTPQNDEEIKKLIDEYADKVLLSIGITFGSPSENKLPNNINNLKGMKLRDTNCYLIIVEINKQTLLLYETIGGKIEKVNLKEIDENFFKNPATN